MSNVKIIDIHVESTQNGLLRATSPQIVGLHVVAGDRAKLLVRARAMLGDLFAAQGEDVSVYDAEPRDAQEQPPFVVVPKILLEQGAA